MNPDLLSTGIYDNFSYFPYFLLNVLREKKSLRSCRLRVAHTPTLYVTLAKVKERKSFLKAHRWLQSREKKKGTQ